MNFPQKSAYLFLGIATIGLSSCTNDASHTSISTDVVSTQSGATENPSTYSLDFDTQKYTHKTFTFSGETIPYRAYENIVYVSKPVDTKYQSMNIYIPEAYFSGQTINGYTIDTAPIFLPNKVGGYMPAEPGTVDASNMGGMMGRTSMSGSGMNNSQNIGQMSGQVSMNTSGGMMPQVRPSGDANSAIKVALSKGYIVASPGARGRTIQDTNGKYTGKAPAGIVDLKAAVAYLHYNDVKIPGDSNKIISNGTSAGGAMSSLLGATGDNPDYLQYLREIGAADASTSVFAVSAYCPITNLDNADMAYEWLFDGIYNYTGRGGNGTMTDSQIELSKKLTKLFPEYINSLGLTDDSGTILALNADGNGTFKTYLEKSIISSAQKALDNGSDLSSYSYLTVEDKKVTGIDFDGFVQALGRMKTTPAFDGVDLSTGENNLFGDDSINAKHFTLFGMNNGTVSGTMADTQIIKMMNPMNYIGSENANTSKYWRIRVGSKDSDTSTAISLILATYLRNKGFNADYAISWGQPHSGDYDTNDLTDWIDSIVKGK
ncbi:MAG: subtype B tannase [Candidatus Altimarinota bacterium]